MAEKDRRKSCCDAIVQVVESLKIYKWLWGLIFLALLSGTWTVWAGTNDLKLEYKVFSKGVEMRLIEIKQHNKVLETKVDILIAKLDKLLERKREE